MPSAGSGSWLPVIQIHSRPRCMMRKAFAIVVGKTRRAAAVVETVAQGDDATRRIMRNQTREPRECRGGVIGRQQHAARGKARAFFEMQVGDRQQPLLRPVQRAVGIGEESDPVHHNVILAARVSARAGIMTPTRESGFRVRRCAAPRNDEVSLTSSPP